MGTHGFKIDRRGVNKDTELRGRKKKAMLKFKHQNKLAKEEHLRELRNWTLTKGDKVTITTLGEELERVGEEGDGM